MGGDVLVHFTNRLGGESPAHYESNNLAFHVGDNPLHVEQNRASTCETLGVEFLVSMEQVHGDNIVIVEEQKTQIIPKCDGLITAQKNLALMVMVADCTPVILVGKTLIAALHVGRAGMEKQIVKKAVNIFREFGESEIKAYLGASIKQCCYELGGEVLNQMSLKYPLHVKKNHLDINGVIVEQLQSVGVEDIEIDSTCTSCDERYFSYRRDGVTGRFAGIVIRRE